MSNAVISVRGISKCYPVFESARARVLHTIWPKYERGVGQHWALRNIDFEVQKGESVAIIGRNGGGKSTLLEILTGTLQPTAGTVSVQGRVSALLELGSGFNPEYTGRDNVLLNGLLLGLSREEILARFPEIEEFAEIGDAIDRPVKTYSSGMMMRLAFSVQVLCDPDILIVDEALSVGDFFFQQKCFNRLRAMREKGLTLLFVSHDMGTVRDLCQRAVYLRNGEQVYAGETQGAIRRYFGEGSDPIPTIPATVAPSLGDGSLPQFQDAIAWSRPATSVKPLLAVRVLDGAGCDTTAVRLGGTVKVRVYFEGGGDMENLCVGLVLKNRYDQVVNASNSIRLGFERIVSRGCAWSAFDFDIDMHLEGGLYSLRVTLSVPTGRNRVTELDSTGWFGPLEVQWDYENEAAPFLGLFGLPVRGALV